MSWHERARCQGSDPEMFFDHRKGAERRAKAVCADCPVRLECLTASLSFRAEFGVWGGLSGPERRALLRSRPAHTDWKALVLATGILATPAPAEAPVGAPAHPVRV
jgi:WhiB family redox-sensing transcriptional regulator